MAKNAGKTVAEILRSKKANIRYAALAPGFPNWDDILHLTWEEVVERAKKRQTGYRAIRKLLSDGRFDK